MNRLLTGQSSLFYAAALVSVLGGLARTKIVAVGLGVYASGALGQASSVVTVVGLVSSLGLWAVAAREFSSGGIKDLHRSGAVLIVVGSASALAMLVVLIAGAGLLETLGLVWPFGAVTIASIAMMSGFANVAPVWWRSRRRGGTALLVTGTAQIVATTLCIVAVSADSLLPLALALLSTFAVPALAFLVLEVIPRFSRLITREAMRPNLIRLIVAGGLVGMLTVATRSVSDLVSRVMVINSFGEVANGLTQPYYAYTAVLLPQFVSIMSTLTIVSWKLGATAVTRQVLRAVALLVVLAAVFATFAQQIVTLLFSSAFLDGAPLLAWGAAADTGKWLAAILLSVLVAANRLRWAIFVALLSVGSRLVLVHYLIDPIGLEVIAASTAFESSFSLLILSLLLRDVLGRRAFLVVLSVAAAVAGIGVACVLLT